MLVRGNDDSSSYLNNTCSYTDLPKCDTLNPDPGRVKLGEAHSMPVAFRTRLPPSL